jgi:WD40 repeat protein
VKDLYDNNNNDDDNDDDTKRNVTTLARSRCGTKLAVGLRMGTVRSYGFPCMSSSFDEDEAHVSRDVKCVRWSSEDTFVLSLAKSDRSFLQWRVKTDENNNNNNTEIVEKIIAKNKNEKDEEEEWILENSQEGDNYMSVLPWLGAVKAPTIPELLTQDKTRPKYDMRKSWIYGISCRNMRNFVRYDAVNDVVYPASACSIKYDPDTNRQDHNSDHTNTITAFAISSDGKIAATGQRGRDAVVIVWCTRTMKSLATLRGHRRAVVQIAFSNDGKTVASAGADDGHTVLVHNWQSESKQKIRTGQNLLLHLCFSGNNSMFVAAGKKCVYFFESKGRSNARWRKRRAGIVSGSKVKGELERFTGVCFVDDEDDLKSKRVLVTVGTPTKQSGQIYEFDSSTKRLMAIHNVTSSPILAIHSHKLLRTIAIGCVDGTVCVIDSTNMNTLRVLSFETSIRSVCQSLLDNKILVGTDRGQIFEATGVKTLTKLLESHFGGEICGVVTSPSSSECASCGEDGTVRVWNLERHEQICVRDVGGRATSITYDPTGKRLVVCVQHHHKDNTINLVELDAITLKELRRLETKARKPCRVVQFSPDGRMIALASNDHNIYLHASANLKCRHVLGKHNAVVQNLDWTSDSRYLHSTCAGHELLFWDAERGQHMPGGATTLRDAEWASWTCTLGWPVKGLDVNTEDQSICFVSASNNSKLLVCGYDTGNVRLVHYPCPDSAGSVLKRGHASKMCRADWIHGGTSSKLGFVTAGSRDAALIQWNLYMSSDTSSSMSS